MTLTIKHFLSTATFYFLSGSAESFKDVKSAIQDIPVYELDKAVEELDLAIERYSELANFSVPTKLYSDIIKYINYWDNTLAIAQTKQL